MYGEHRRLTRQELYELVWSTPATKLGERFGLSGRGLAKLCERHDIPVPERGWWAKKAAGHKVETPPLPPAKATSTEIIQVYVHHDFRDWLSAEEEDLFEKRLQEELAAPPPIVPELDESRHPLIVQSRKKRRNTDGPVPAHIQITVSEPLRDRALRLATAIVMACESRGYTFAPLPDASDGVARVYVFGFPIGIWIDEPPRKVPHVLTAAEAREKAVGRGWQIPEFDHVPSGQLSMLIDHSAYGERRSFSGGKEREIEGVLPDLMKALLKIAMRLRAEQNRKDEDRRQREEAADLRRQEELQRQQEQARIAAARKRRRELLRDGANFRRAYALVEMIAAVKEIGASEAVNGEALAEWVRHAEAIAESLNPVARIIETLRSADERTKTKSSGA